MSLFRRRSFWTGVVETLYNFLIGGWRKLPPEQRVWHQTVNKQVSRRIRKFGGLLEVETRRQWNAIPAADFFLLCLVFVDSACPEAN